MRKLLCLFFAVVAALAWMPVRANENQPDLVEVIEISGEINQGSVEMFSKMIEGIAENKKIKAVVLVVDSPGGGAIASAALYEAVGRIKVPVVGWCGYVCASGGYYVLMAPSVKHIGIRAETVTGSVGVIMSIARFNRLLEWAKIDAETYVSGRLKDAGNPTRAARDEERKYLQSILDELAERFYEIVGKARGNKIGNAWQSIKTGRIFIGKTAVNVGLVDSIMSREDAIKKAKELSGSKLIFTREEIRKMSKVADQYPTYGAPVPSPQMQPFGDLPWLIDLLKEIRAGESVKFEYRLPHRF